MFFRQPSVSNHMQHGQLFQEQLCPCGPSLKQCMAAHVQLGLQYNQWESSEAEKEQPECPTQGENKIEYNIEHLLSLYRSSNCVYLLNQDQEDTDVFSANQLQDRFTDNMSNMHDPAQLYSNCGAPQSFSVCTGCSQAND